ncbi:uncharacterized protein LOC143300571 isoform X2 [Babylonia areolata]|uniref:uncharacterized protein LOC143300571 isoform X2 n=1 Tax=Babylonia areolata TaxID=304850 RepID=UPI003FD1D14F
MDAETERLLERTRQRRELLDQKMGKSLEPAPRKRRSPLSEDLTSNVEGGSAQNEDSPKRQCVREKESAIKPDTPAIASVKSRLHALSAQRSQWAEEGTENEGSSSPVPQPRKSMASPPLVERAKAADEPEPPQPSSQRKSRFAQLASSINNWEDDLSHPTIVKEEEKKPRWQPPKAAESIVTTPSKSAKASSDPVPVCASTSRRKSPKKSVSSVPPKSADSTVRSPLKLGSKAEDSDVARPSGSPVKSSVSSQSDAGTKPEPSSNQETGALQEKEANLGMEAEVEECKKSNVEEEKEKPTSSNKGEESRREAGKVDGHKKGAEAPKTVLPPADRPLSARLANWEQKISDSNAPGTPKPTAATPGKLTHLAKDSTPARPLSTPSVEESEAVQLRPKPRKTVEDEPTAHSVSARMSAWEQISSAQVVSSIKKVKPGDCTPVKTPAAQKSPVKNATGTPAKTCTQDSIKERIAQLSTSATPQKASATPGKTPAVGSATKSAQWQPSQQSTTDKAQRLRQERMAELQGIQNRWKNGILKDDKDAAPEDPPQPQSSSKKEKRQGLREKARADFENKLATIGLEVSDKDGAKETEEAASKSHSTSTSTDTVTSSGSAVTGKPPRPTSLFSIVSQQKAEGAVSSPRPVSTAATSKACRKVKFDDSFDTEDPHPLPKKQTLLQEASAEPVAEEGKVEDDEDAEVILRRPRPRAYQQGPKPEDDDDDVSLSAFVPRSVRAESMMPSEQQGGQDLDSSINSLDSFEGAPGAPPDFHKSTVDLVKLGQQYADSDSCSSLNTADSTSQSAVPDQPQTSGHTQDMEESVDDRDAIGDLLDEAMDSDSGEGPSTSSAKPPVPVMRKKNNQRKATAAGDLPFSINEYRASRNMQIQEVKQTIVRNSQYVGKAVKEEDVEMPTSTPTPAPRRSVQDRIKELQEMVQQEQSIIMQTSNALNQCCSSTSHFAGSSEQVECNRILLISCQKRQAYMREIQRLKDSQVLDPSGPGPKGSLTISDIRLPLKKDFVTKIGTSQDTMTYYFILLLKHGPKVISTQMLSTHDPMMRGSLDFPNLININDITGSFQLQLEIYSMSISCEASGKDKKKKTPKKLKGSALTVQSPGGPMAVRTTCFSQVTTVLLTMKSVDKHSFTLDRLSHLSPLHGTIHMNLKCLMEANVEEKGFLTMFEDVSGLGSWHRRWCVLSGNKLRFWKYPDDETRKEPMGYIDLKRCVTEKVGLISRDVCARPHTFELNTVRQPLKGEKDTLVSRTYSTMTTVRHMLSADTKEERIVWCNKVNRALATIRTWHADAMRPIKH